MPAMMMLAGDVDGDDMIKGADQAECSQLLLEDFFPFFFFFFHFQDKSICPSKYCTCAAENYLMPFHPVVLPLNQARKQEK